ncbi:MAG: O-antigen ligase family protein, partial [Bacillota bacterium]|nr:O-antigen ligase family protein [Bacillota bacterium]
MIKVRSAMLYMIYLYIFALPLFMDTFLSGRAGDLLLLLIFLIYFVGVLLNKSVRDRFIYGITHFYKDILDLFIIILFIAMGFSVFYSYEKSIAVTETIRFLSYIILYFII